VETLPYMPVGGAEAAVAPELGIPRAAVAPELSIAREKRGLGR
jgi:hypothetical protein